LTHCNHRVTLRPRRKQGERSVKNVMLAAAVLLLFGCSQPAPPAPDLKSQIDANNAAWTAAANRGDAAALAAMYTDNATMLPPGMEMQRGRAAVQKTATALLGSGIRNFTLASVDVAQIAPDTAREIGRFTLEARDPKKRWVKIEGKYVVIWKLVGGKWLLDVDIWNANR
jgi:uncharacterized protein (TIGR02246 family)